MKEKYYSKLNKEEKKILKDKGTEAPFTGEYNDFFEAGVFVCKACESPLYESKTKFNSGCGWPSFEEELEGSIVKHEDLSGGRRRTEICCKKCDGHLGHVFEGENMTLKNTRHCVNSLSIKFIPHENLEQAIFGAGCFWHIEKIFRETKGVYLAESGYMGGDILNPTYNEICMGNTNHAEVVRVSFNPKIISYSNLLHIFWDNHNPTTLNQQGSDIGSQYRSVIFYYCDAQKTMAKKSLKQFQANFSDLIVTKIIPKEEFYRAEEYHQNYLNKNKLGSCTI